MERFEAMFREIFSENVSRFGHRAGKARFGADDIREMIRIVHNIKSDAAMMNHSAISKLAETSENLLRNLPETGPVPERVRQLLRDAVSWFENALETLKKGLPGMEFAEDLIREMQMETERMGHRRVSGKDRSPAEGNPHR